MCMTIAGRLKPGSRVMTLAKRGVFETDPTLEEQFSGCSVVARKRCHAHPMYRKCYAQLEEELEKDGSSAAIEMPHLLDGADRVYFQSGRRRGPGPGAYLYGGGTFTISGNMPSTRGIPHEQSSGRIAAEILDSLPADCAEAERPS